MDTFRVGEICIVHRTPAIGAIECYVGQECEIIDPLNFKLCISSTDGGIGLDYAYGVRMQDESRWAVLPENLKRRPAPPDWEKLATADELPVEEIA